MKTEYLKTIGYIRWSSEPQEDGNSSTRQTEKINRAAERFNVPLYKIFTDSGVSAFKGKNLLAEWSKLKSSLVKGDLVAVENTDRITRKGVHTLLNELGDVINRGAEVYLCDSDKILNSENYDTELITLVQGTIARQEDVKKSGRIQRAKSDATELLRQGKFVKSGSLPFWIKNGVEKFEVVEDRALLVRRMFDLYSKGYGLCSIAGLLNKENIPSPSGKKWGAPGVNRILRYKSVLGFANQFEDDVMLYPPILSKEIYQAVQHKLFERRRYTGRKEKTRINIFRKLIECKTCGQLLKQHLSKTRYQYYVCNGPYFGMCDFKAVSGPKLEKAFQFLICNSVARDKIGSILNEEQIDPHKVDTMKGQLADVRNKINRITDLIVDSSEDPKTLLKRLKDLEIEERRLTQEISIEEAIVRSNKPVASLLKDQEKFEGQWNKPEIRLQLREYIRGIVDKIIVDKNEKSFEVHFKTAKQSIKVALGKERFLITFPLVDDPKGYVLERKYSEVCFIVPSEKPISTHKINVGRSITISRYV